MERGDAATPEISAILLRVLAEVSLKHGVAPDQLFEGEGRAYIAGVPADVRVPLEVFRALVRRAITLTGEPALGLRCGTAASDSSFDLFAPLLAHVPSLRHAIRETSRFLVLAFNAAQVHVTESIHTMTVRWEYPRGEEVSDRFIAELSGAGMLRMVQTYGGTHADVHAVRFEHKRPDYPRAYSELFRGVERFSSAFTGIELSASLLDRPHLHHNPALQAIVHAQAVEQLALVTRSASLSSRIATYLANRRGARLPDMDEAARDLQLSVRTLRRRLADEGVSYRDLTQRAQLERARELMRDPTLGLKAIAVAVGFTELAAFHRAFKRWTGQPAAAYRRDSLGDRPGPND